MKCLNTFILASFISVNSMFAMSQFPDWNGEARTKWTQWKNGHVLSTEVKGRFFFTDGDSWAEITPKLKIFDADNKTRINSVCVDLEKCLVGFAFNTDPANEMFVEIGRNKMEDLFDSKLQFGSMFNGIHAIYQTPNLVIHGGSHIISSFKDEYGAIGEAYYKFSMIPLKLCYSFSHWNEIEDTYNISQASISYDVLPFNGKMINAYAGTLYNHKASEENWGHYMGIRCGKIEVAKDYSFDFNLQHAEFNSIPVYDYKGIGGDGDGIEFKASYALTDHFIVAGKIAYNFNDSNASWSEVSAIYKW